MDGFIHEILSYILTSSSPAVTAMLLALLTITGWLMYKRDKDASKERQELITKFQEQLSDDRKDLLEIIDKYQEGQISVIQAMNDIKVLIASLGAKL
jgi:hypothetical protein